MKKKITAVIPVRAGSQRVKNKNLRSFANVSLLELKIDTLIKANVFSEIIVNTDSEIAIEIAKSKNVNYHLREAYYASSECSGSDFFQHLGLVTDTDIFAYCPATSPFIQPTTLVSCVERYLEGQGEFDCLSTVSAVKEFLWLDGKPLNYELTKAPNSQDLPDIVALNFGFTLVERNVLIKNKNIIGDNPTFLTISEIESTDIDTELDFYLAEQMYIKTVLENKSLID